MLGFALLLLQSVLYHMDTKEMLEHRIEELLTSPPPINKKIDLSSKENSRKRENIGIDKFMGWPALMT